MSEPDLHDHEDLIAHLRGFLDALSATEPGAAERQELVADLVAWTERLGPARPENDALYQSRERLPGRGRAAVPPLIVLRRNAHGMAGTVRFGSHFLGRNAAAHGGAVAMLFDEAMGGLVNAGGQPRSRTAYLHVDYLQVTPIDRDLDVEARVVTQEGRKKILEATLSSGSAICAKATGLFVTLKPGQP